MTDGEVVCLGLESPNNETLETLGNVLGLTDVFQVFDDFFVGFVAAEDDVCASR